MWTSDAAFDVVGESYVTRGLVATGLSKPGLPLKQAEKSKKGERRLMALFCLDLGGRTCLLDTEDGVIILYFLYKVKALTPHHQRVSLLPQFSLSGKS